MQLMQYFINIENVSAYEIYALNCSQKNIYIIKLRIHSKYFK